jgi:TRAP-type C4-dicarboxylate transport system permease small subunit
MLMTAASTASMLIFDKPLQGDYEMMKHFIAIAVFCFLPYCQLTGANVTADIFTQNAGPRMVALLALLSAIIALLFSLLLTWRMSLGLIDYRQYGETTVIMNFPIWLAFIPIVFSLALLALASLVSVGDALAEVRASNRGEATGR